MREEDFEWGRGERGRVRMEKERRERETKNGVGEVRQGQEKWGGEIREGEQEWGRERRGIWSMLWR